MINKIHQDVREIFYRFSTNKNLFFLDKSANTLVLASNDATHFGSAERFFKKEFGIDLSSIPMQDPDSFTQKKTVYFEHKRIKYKSTLTLTHHMNGAITFLLMLTVSFLPV